MRKTVTHVLMVKSIKGFKYKYSNFLFPLKILMSKTYFRLETLKKTVFL